MQMVKNYDTIGLVSELCKRTPAVVGSGHFVCNGNIFFPRKDRVDEGGRVWLDAKCEDAILQSSTQPL